MAKRTTTQSQQAQQQYHANGSVRHAEKRRTGTCPFADRVARISIQAFHERVPESWRDENKQVCLATIVAHIQKHNSNDEGQLKVLGMGVGTKFLSENVLQEEKILGGAQCPHIMGAPAYGMRIRDCHAEVLARRAFRRRLALEMESHIKGDPISDSILSYRPSAAEVLNSGTRSKVFSLVSGVTLHMYTSSAPCGNACLKKFAKMSKEQYDASMGKDEWPLEKHEPLASHSLHLGRFSLLVKRDYASDGKTESNTHNFMCHISAKERKWPANLDDKWCPPGTTVPHVGKGSIHTCSDKICRWNVIGLQGSLLSSLLVTPIYMDTLTIGRKFTKCIAQRAVCCRVGLNDIQSTKRKRDSKDVVPHERMDYIMFHHGYKINHPCVMGTGVYLDDSGVLDMSGEKTVGQDVRFQSSLCWTWCPNNDDEIRYNAECIDGETGFLYYCLEKKDSNEMSCIPSLVSTFALTNQFLSFAKGAPAIEDVGVMEYEKVGTLKQLRDLKRIVAPGYEDIKDELLHRHGVFYYWNRRDDCIVVKN